MGAAPSNPLQDDSDEEYDDARSHQGEKLGVEASKEKKGIAKLYKYTDGKYTLAGASVYPRFLNESEEEEEDDDRPADRDDDETQQHPWFLAVPPDIYIKVSDGLSARSTPQQKRVDFIASGVWSLKFGTKEKFDEFQTELDACLFENRFGIKHTTENVEKVAAGFTTWFDASSADDEMWDAPEGSAEPATPPPSAVREVRETPSKHSAHSLAMGAKSRSYVVHSGGLEVFRNLAEGIDSDGLTIGLKSPAGSRLATPKKTMLMAGEQQMMLLTPQAAGSDLANSVHQLDLETEKVVTEWKFDLHGVNLNMMDITPDAKAAQLGMGSTFMGLDKNQLCRWDTRDRKGVVQTLDYKEGHSFARGTNFRCMATTGNGCVAVGSQDGKIRLYSTTSMRQAKTSFPGLGAPITHIDVTFDGRWVVATTDSYLLVISTVFRDKKGGEKTGFTAKMGGNIAAPRLLKLTPEHVSIAGADARFRGGQFSWVTEQGFQERNIVATVGSFSVIWNFRRVKQSNHSCYQDQTSMKVCYCYKVVPKQDSIVDSRFMHDSFHGQSSPEVPLVVATADAVSSFNI